MRYGMTNRKDDTESIDDRRARGLASFDGAEAGGDGRSGEITPLELIWLLAQLIENDAAIVGVLVEFARRRWLSLSDSIPEQRLGGRFRQTTLMELSGVLVELLPNDRSAVDVL